ncbi:MAG: hypothetical protein OEP52_06360 [Acidimicrobiia bacterium]|nr:hypothetical protein [Acidimicrobiia bacterium]
MDTNDQSFGYIEGGQIAAPMPDQQLGANRARRWVLGGLVTIAILAIAAVAFATMNARSNDGADSPTAAMQKFFDGLSGENLVAAVEAFLPEEADPVINYTGAIGTELKRLEVLTDSVNPQAVSGIDMNFTDLEFRLEQVAPGFVRVYVVNGDAFIDIDPAELPLGNLVLDNLPPEVRDELANDPPPESDSMAGGDFYLMAVQEDDGWYLSLWYTVMDAIFSEAGYGTPDFAAGVKAAGADSPKAAVEAAFRHVLALDLEGLIGMLPPTEMRALYDYMPLVFDDYNETVGALGSFVTIELKSLGTSVSDAGNGAKRVRIDTFDIAFSSFFVEVDGTISFDGACFDITINDAGGALSQFGAAIPENINSCAPEIANALGSGLTGVEMPDFLGDLRAAETGLIAVEENGRWFVSPTETLGDTLLQGLQIWDKATLQEYIDWLVEVGSEANATAFF